MSILSKLDEYSQIVSKGDEPECAAALKQIWDLVPSESPNLPIIYHHP